MYSIVDVLFAEHKYVTFEWRIGEDRSLTQNSLLHVWLTLYAAHLLRIPKKAVDSAILAGIKRKAKKMFYEETGEAWMVHRIIDPWHPDKQRMDFTSSSDWSRGECYMFMNWLQNKAGEDGLILEATGEYAKNKRQQIA